MAEPIPPPIADWPTKQRWVDEAFDRFKAEGYIVSSAYTLVKPSDHSGFVYRDALWQGADLIGTGVASFSHFQGVHYQNVDGWDEYVARCQKGELPINRAHSAICFLASEKLCVFPMCPNSPRSARSTLWGSLVLEPWGGESLWPV